MSEKGGLRITIEEWLRAGLDIFFPPQCVGCGRIGISWCAKCRLSVKPIHSGYCPACGAPDSRGALCNLCRKTPYYFESARSFSYYEEPFRRIILSLKYQGERGLGLLISNTVASFIDQLNWSFDLIMPVPLGEERQKERGYNQVSLYAKPVSRKLNKEYHEGLVKRLRDTRSQVGLSPSGRKRNVAGAFVVPNPEKVRGRNLLICDDVFTTGATLNACARAAKSAGANHVFAFTLARAKVASGQRSKIS